MSNLPDYYEILEVHPKASQEVIQNAYRALVKKYHPDIYDGDKRSANNMMSLINQAYEVLSDKSKRQVYDNQLNISDKIYTNDSQANSLENLIKKAFMTCTNIIDKCDTSITKDEDNTLNNIAICDQLMADWDRDVKPVLNILLPINISPYERPAFKAKEPAFFDYCALTLWVLAGAYTWANGFQKARNLLVLSQVYIYNDNELFQKILSSLETVEKSINVLSNQSNNQDITLEVRQLAAARNIAKSNNEEILKNPKVRLYTINGIGTSFYGQADFDAPSNSYITQYWFSFFYFPIFPLRRYRVISKDDSSYLIISKLPFNNTIRDLSQMYLSKPFSLVAWIAIFYVIFALNTSPSTTPTKSNIKPMPISNSAPEPKLTPKANVLTQYIKKEPYLNANGYCQLTIDNTRNDAPVYVRIWNLNNATPVRAFTIHQGEKFTADNLTPGRYEVRYKYLYENIEATTGSKSETIPLTQRNTASGAEYETVSLTLYKVSNGNTKTYSIPATEI